MRATDLNHRAAPTPRAYWRAHVAGLALGLVLLATFIVTGHGLGASGFATALAAQAAGATAPEAALRNAYLGPIVAAGHPIDAWITWQMLGVAMGALVSAMWARQFRWYVAGPPRLGSAVRLALATGGGIVAGFGARLAAGCTSGLGLSGSATLAVAGFVFLIGFFAAGLVAGRALRGWWR